MPANSIHCISCKRLLGWMPLSVAIVQYPDGCNGCSAPTGSIKDCKSILDTLEACWDRHDTYFCDDVGKPLRSQVSQPKK